MSATCNTINGSSGILKIKEETAFGEFEQTGYTKIAFQTNSVMQSQSEVESETILSGRQPSRKFLGNKEVSGDLTVALEDKASYHLLKNLFGKVESVNVGGLEQHTFSIEDGCLNSLAAEKSFTGTDINFLASGLKTNSVSFEVGGEGEIPGTFNIMGKSEELRKVTVDAKTDTIAANGLVDDTVISVADGSKFEAGDVIMINVDIATTISESLKGSSIINVGAGEGLNFVKGNLISILGKTYMVKAVSVDKIFLVQGLEEVVAIGTDVFLQENAYKVESVLTNDLTITPALKNDILIGDVVFGADELVLLNGTSFTNFEAEIVSSTETALVNIETCNFSFENNMEGKNTIDSKGSFGIISEGKVNITCEMTLIFSSENAKMLEEAKAGKVFDLTIRLSNDLGHTLEFIMPQGTLTPGGVDISTPTAISTSVTYSPFKENETEAITAVLTNSMTY